jgi:hypothetical protein
MPTRWFNSVVVMFWLATMSWLAVTKVLPPLRVGEPPSYRSILAQNHNADLPVGWTIRLNNNTLGWAATKVVTRADGMTAIQGRLYLQELPFDELAPGWLSRWLKPIVGVGTLELEARSRVDIDPLGRLTSFETRVQIAEMPDAIRVHGMVEGTQLHVTLASGDISFKEDRYLPPGAFVGDELQPQATLPGLRVGQSWTMPVYSPLRPHKNPMEVLQATVIGQERIRWNGESTEAMLVVYRSDSGSGLSSRQDPRAKLWVRGNGDVLRQQLMFFNSPLWFERLAEEPSEQLAEHFGANWSRDFSPGTARRLLKQLIVAANAPDQHD